MAQQPDMKNIKLDQDIRRQLKKMALPSGKSLKVFIEDLLQVMVEFQDYSSAKWLTKQANKR